MSDLRSPRVLYLKAVLFIVLGLLAGGLLVLRDLHWQTALLLGIAIWSFCRAYYFFFYVIDRYIAPEDRFSGLVDFFRRRNQHTTED